MEKQLRILMIEADPADAGVIEDELCNAGIEFTTRRVETQTEFESQLKGFAPDVILSDYWLSSFDGPTALAIAREEYPLIPFIFVSSAVGEELAADAIRDGAADFVLKVDLSRLPPALRRAIREAAHTDGRQHPQPGLGDGEETSGTLLDLPFGIASMVDADLNLLSMNRTGAEKLGKSVQELIGTNIMDLFGSEVAETRRRQLQDVFSTGETLHFEDECEGMCLDFNLFPIAGSGGEVNRVVILALDVTNRKQAEEAQARDRDFIQKVLNTAGALVVVRERQGRMVLFNRKAEQLTGYGSHEIAGKRVWDVFVDRESYGRSRAVFNKLLAGEEAQDYEEYWKTRTGDRRLILLSNATLAGADNKVEYVITTGIDITESRSAEEKLKESEVWYRTVFESSGTAMCIVDREARIVFLNHEFERVTGYKAREVVGKKSFTDFLPGEGADSFKGYLRDIQSSEAESPIHFECELVARDGYVLNMMANVGSMPGLDTNAVSLVDVTQEKLYEGDLRERAERLRDFLVVASHELRHPITIVKGYSHLLADRMDTMSPERIHDILQDITSSTDRLTRSVEQLLDISRIEQGQVAAVRQPVDVGQLVDTALEDMAVMGCDNQFIRRVEVGDDEIAIDPEKFVQLLNVLLDNAVKFSPEGSPVEVDLERDGQILVVSVLDRGRGIPADSQEKIFDRFYQVEDAAHHSKTGLGLGLYIACKLVQAHGGNIWMEPRMGGGSIFRFTLYAGCSDLERS
jgi:PAS domain S-box-containing protein